MRTRRRPVAWPNLTPMIDVVFLLVVFFMISTTFTEREAALELTLPAADGATVEPAPEDLVLELAASGSMLANGEPLVPAMLPALLEEQTVPTTRVVLRADEAVAHGRVVEVLDACREHGLTSIAIATKPR